MHSGLFSDLSDCGTRSDWYTYVFVGQLSSITPTEKDEKKIQIIPEEIFSGKPKSPVTVLTSQGPCLPPMAIGDRWLFYLRKVEGKPIVLDYYGNDSLPVALAQDRIEMLRRLSSIGDSALLRGTVKRGDSFEGKPLPLAQVFATRNSDNQRFVAITDQKGVYQFEPLPPGKYEITIGAVGTYQPDNSSIELKRGSCWDLTLSRSPHARMSGHIKHADGSPAGKIDVVLVNADNSGYVTTQTDEQGRFSFDSQSAGNFVVGVNYPPRTDWANGSGGITIPRASLFYSASPDRAGAETIHLDADQKIDNIDFILPAS